MNRPIIARLIVKDLLIWRKLILIFCGASLACIGLLAVLCGRIPHVVFVNLGLTLLVTPTVALGIVLLIQTNVFERVRSTQNFIMSLPVTATDFTLAKLLVNIPVFAAVWLVTSLAGFYFAFGRGFLPAGSVPFLTMIFLGVFVSYCCILSVSLVSQSLGATVGALMFFDLVTPAYLWTILFLTPIGSFVDGPVAVWNSAAIAIVLLQAVAAVVAVSAAVFMQGHRRDIV
jgi:hypothetical protein